MFYLDVEIQTFQEIVGSWVVKALPPPAATVGSTLLPAGTDWYPQKQRRRENRSSICCHCWRPFHGVSGKKAAKTQIALLLKELRLHQEKRDVPYQVHQKEPELRYPTSSHRSKQRSGMKINRNEMMKPGLQPQIDANNEKYHQLSFGSHMPQNPGSSVCRTRETDLVCLQNIYKKAFSVIQQLGTQFQALADNIFRNYW